MIGEGFTNPTPLLQVEMHAWEERDKWPLIKQSIIKGRWRIQPALWNTYYYYYCTHPLVGPSGSPQPSLIFTGSPAQKSEDIKPTEAATPSSSQSSTLHNQTSPSLINPSAHSPLSSQSLFGVWLCSLKIVASILTNLGSLQIISNWSFWNPSNSIITVLSHSPLTKLIGAGVDDCG